MKRIVGTAAALLLSAGAAGSAHSVSHAAARTPVKYADIKDNPEVDGEFFYLPKKLTIKVGTRVTWRNKSIYPHTVTDRGTPRHFNSGDIDHLIQPDQQYSHTFRHPGTFTYYCIIHPDMQGKIVVKT